MTIEEIRKNAPDGATGYFNDEHDNDIYYFKIVSFDVYQFIDNEWSWVDNIKDCPDYYNELKPL